MSIRAKLVRSAALAAVALAAWRFLSPPAEAPLGNTPQPASEKAVANLPPVQTPTTAGPDRVAPDWQSVQSRPGASQRAAPGADPLLEDPVLREWIDAWRPDGHQPSPAGDTANLIHAADIWHSVKRHWCAQARRLLAVPAS